MSEQNEHALVLRALEDYIFETHKICDLSLISDTTGLSPQKCRKILDTLERQDQVVKIFSGSGKPDLFIPHHMWQGVLMTQPKPTWMDDYALEEKQVLLDEMKTQEKKIHELEAFERLLYSTDIPLERSVAAALKYLRFENVVHHEKDRDREDVSFQFDDNLYLVEVKGKKGQGDKDDIEQLNGWITQQMEKEKLEPEQIRGIYVINHFRHANPSQRGDPLTDHAKRWLRRYRFGFFTTPFLYQTVIDAMSKRRSKKDARELVISGESFKS